MKKILEMKYQIGPIFGLLYGISMIVFREKICEYLEKFYERMPKYKDGVESLNIRFSIRPIFITMLVIVIIFFCLLSFIMIEIEG